MWLFKFNFNKIKNSVPHLQYLHFKSFVGMSSWLLYWTEQIWSMPPLQRISVGQHREKATFGNALGIKKMTQYFLLHEQLFK